jgi:hypothetical protein
MIFSSIDFKTLVFYKGWFFVQNVFNVNNFLIFFNVWRVYPQAISFSKCILPQQLQKSNFKTLKETTNYVCDFINFNDVGNQL